MTLIATTRRMPAMKPVGKPDAGNPHVRFDERGWETGQHRRVSYRAHPRLYYLPLYIFCGRHLLAAKLRSSDVDGAAGAVEEVARIVGQIRARWPRVRILLRADSGFCREALMAWCEANRVDYVFGLARNPRLTAEIATEMAAARAAAERTGKPARRFKDFRWIAQGCIDDPHVQEPLLYHSVSFLFTYLHSVIREILNDLQMSSVVVLLSAYNFPDKVIFIHTNHLPNSIAPTSSK